jgi:hypothetical protein
MGEPLDYSFDVFFSYKRHELTAEWTRRVQEHLKLWLSEEMQRAITMFVDVETLEIGSRWPDKLQAAIKVSRCMVSVWSPLYFQSSWCVSEWKSFLEREKRADIVSHGLIAPVCFHDGEHFPAEAKLVQSLDVRAYASALPAFWLSPRSLELEDRIKKLAGSVAKIIHAAPAFRPDWPIVEADGAIAPRIPLGRL